MNPTAAAKALDEVMKAMRRAKGPPLNEYTGGDFSLWFATNKILAKWRDDFMVYGLMDELKTAHGFDAVAHRLDVLLDQAMDAINSFDGAVRAARTHGVREKTDIGERENKTAVKQIENLQSYLRGVVAPSIAKKKSKPLPEKKDKNKPVQRKQRRTWKKILSENRFDLLAEADKIEAAKQWQDEEKKWGRVHAAVKAALAGKRPEKMPTIETIRREVTRLKKEPKKASKKPTKRQAR